MKSQEINLQMNDIVNEYYENILKAKYNLFNIRSVGEDKHDGIVSILNIDNEYNALSLMYSIYGVTREGLSEHITDFLKLEDARNLLNNMFGKDLLKLI